MQDGELAEKETRAKFTQVADNGKTYQYHSGQKLSEYRVCGRADKILSNIVLDKPDAADTITPQDQGMFLTNTDVLFQAYYVEDDCLKGVAASAEQTL